MYFVHFLPGVIIGYRFAMSSFIDCISPYIKSSLLSATLFFSLRQVYLKKCSLTILLCTAVFTPLFSYREIQVSLFWMQQFCCYTHSFSRVYSSPAVVKRTHFTIPDVNISDNSYVILKLTFTVHARYHQLVIKQVWVLLDENLNIQRTQSKLDLNYQCKLACKCNFVMEAKLFT